MLSVEFLSGVPFALLPQLLAAPAFIAAEPLRPPTPEENFERSFADGALNALRQRQRELIE
ncbi:hypothetical protein IVB45_17780 [Bradyrhizobium sp. 4]|uniref:hypothetical protein n=1 Tax=unclassified Bradyrhizobium TaxID=2631580 RepID=UPI001FF8CD2B|nr:MULTISPECIES: hypothetical protein [unclassified Bradyrhizobium]MCK1401973.1 hypothetical protein [Bradyrhizobium sp. 39]MCK1751307.1 hypothetical protein [Bradyrhizobium sp. 135]UPJ38556.1 hypothetical protein IVB45_17780 [Bradyrhizobium sp. 4]